MHPTGAGGSAGLPGTGISGRAGYQHARSTQRTVLPRTFRTAFQELKDDKTPVVLLVDEAQNWGADQDAGSDRRISTLLSEAHQNSARLPLLIIAAGLADTRDALRRCGVSRLTAGAEMPLEGLSEVEQREVCEAFFERFRIIGSSAERQAWTEAMIQNTDGHPKHLTSALFGAAEALIEGGGDLAQTSIATARESSEGYRDQFYRDQRRPFEAMPEETRPTRSKIEDAIDDAYEKHPKLHDPMARAEVFGNLLHQGLIQGFNDGYDCPIPSMRAHVVKFCARGESPTVDVGAEAVPEPSVNPGM